MTLAETIAAAQAADDAFQAAIEAAGYKSRWDWPMRGRDKAPGALLAAYEAKVAADQLMHEAFEASRRKEVNSLDGMTSSLWSSLSEARRAELRDMSGLSPQLVGLEGWRVEVETMGGEKRRFIVGRSTGWRPCSLEIKTARSSDGRCAEREYKTVRVLERIR